MHCRDPNCTGFAVPEVTGLPQPNWNCNKCNQKSPHANIIKSQDIAIGAINAKANSNSLKTLLVFLRDKVEEFIPKNHFAVIDAKLQVIARLSKASEDCGPDELPAKAIFCQDVLDVLDTLDLGDCVMRAYLEKEKSK